MRRRLADQFGGELWLASWAAQVRRLPELALELEEVDVPPVLSTERQLLQQAQEHGVAEVVIDGPTWRKHATAIQALSKEFRWTQLRPDDE